MKASSQTHLRATSRTSTWTKCNASGSGTNPAALVSETSAIRQGVGRRRCSQVQQHAWIAGSSHVGITHSPLIGGTPRRRAQSGAGVAVKQPRQVDGARSEEHTSELQSLMRISYAVFCLKIKKQNEKNEY